MKSIKFLPVLALALFVSLTLSSCVKDKIARDLEGTWNVTSYEEDGTELIGDIVSSIEMEYDDYDTEEQTGDCTWTVSIPGATEKINGTYEVDQDKAELTVDFENGESATFDIEIDGDELTLSGTAFGVDAEVEAERD